MSQAENTSALPRGDPMSESEMASFSVLVVEDESHIAEGLRYNLEDEGYTVEIVGDGETAISLLTDSSKSYDAVVLDVMLPGKDGFVIRLPRSEETIHDSSELVCGGGDGLGRSQFGSHPAEETA